jgi:chromatin assembly factor 1 subunit B
MPGVSHSATSSFSSTVLGKRDIGAASESEKEDTKADAKGVPELEKPPKRRRIAPTLVSQEETKEN